ncbi:MAG TPA: YbjN domain-containing protein [Actinomycetota bacterium]|nr:YbjN domain-containing protein [Actinomycetota bacterium]
MGRAEIVKPYVEKTLKEFFNTDQLVVTERGEWPVRHGSALYFVRLIDSDPPAVQIYSPMLEAVQQSDAAFRRINELNSEIRFARMFMVDDKIFVATEVVADTLDKGELANAIMAVANIADGLDVQLKGELGGTIAFDDTPAPQVPDRPAPGYA